MKLRFCTIKTAICAIKNGIRWKSVTKKIKPGQFWHKQERDREIFELYVCCRGGGCPPCVFTLISTTSHVTAWHYLLPKRIIYKRNINTTKDCPSWPRGTSETEGDWIVRRLCQLAFHAKTPTIKCTAQTSPILSPHLSLTMTLAHTVPVFFDITIVRVKFVNKGNPVKTAP